MHDDRHDLAQGQPRLASTLEGSAGEQVRFEDRLEVLAEVVDIAEHVKERAHRGFLGLVEDG